ncbi:hypothetical protein [Janibacter cremeus]|uniref:Uncharacterized protein n=1 Tax=Janibacter cremeus TaxID=1285192 RepID=A0A852VJL8_9MICO|nr:hypothetical protein [Janibacter cremeus]NYF97262.1 hypothetical protein [Janibacter cremeus]
MAPDGYVTAGREGGGPRPSATREQVDGEIDVPEVLEELLDDVQHDEALGDDLWLPSAPSPRSSA